MRVVPARSSFFFRPRAAPGCGACRPSLRAKAGNSCVRFDKDALDGPHCVANTRHAVPKRAEINEPIARGDRPRRNIVAAGGDVDVRGRRPPPCHVARRVREARHFRRHPHAGHDAPRVVDEDERSDSASVGNGLDEILKCFATIEASFYATFNHGGMVRQRARQGQIPGHRGSLHRGQSCKLPFVDGTPIARGSIFTASRSARAKALKQISTM